MGSSSSSLPLLSHSLCAWNRVGRWSFLNPSTSAQAVPIVTVLGLTLLGKATLPKAPATEELKVPNSRVVLSNETGTLY